MARSPEQSPIGLKAALIGYALLFLLKIGAWWLTGLFALLAEALHTLSDLAISGFLLAADRFSRRPADARYRYGYGRAQHVAALVAATLFISFTSFRLTEEAVGRLLHPVVPAYSRLGLAIGVLVLSMALTAVPIILLGVQKPRGPAARAQFLESLNDELGLIAALGGVLFVARGWPLADPLAALVVALLIAGNAVGLFRDNARVLMGRAPGREFFDRIEALARTVPAVQAVHDLRAQYVGPDVVNLSLHVEVDPTMTVADGEEVAKAVRDAITAEVRCAYCVVHVDPLGAPPEPGELDF
ncbi:MAG: cation transporter [Candidatus Rokubacteria bacterium]|nr:cation transporter [Candidatus Rokubacteria bacterium]